MMNTTDADNAHEAHEHHEEAGADTTVLAQLLDLDAEVLHAYLAELMGWLAELAGPECNNILDLGSGTGTGALALLERFPHARVTALDLSAHMLLRLSAKAEALGVAGRLDTVEADLNAPWPELAPADLIWAASSLHHMADPDQSLARAFEALRPGGLLAATEMDFFPRFLPDDTGLGGVERRLHAKMNKRPAAEWTDHLARAGFILEEKRGFVVDLSAPLPEATGRYAQATLRQMRAHADGELSEDDLALLDSVLDNDSAQSILRRHDLTVHTTRTTWAARRP